MCVVELLPHISIYARMCVYCMCLFCDVYQTSTNCHAAAVEILTVSAFFGGDHIAAPDMLFKSGIAHVFIAVDYFRPCNRTITLSISSLELLLHFHPGLIYTSRRSNWGEG